MPGKMRLVTKLIDNRHRNRPSNTVQAIVTNTEETLSPKAAEMAHSILQHKRKQFLKAQQGRAGGQEPIQSLRRCGVAEEPDLGWQRIRQMSKR